MKILGIDPGQTTGFVELQLDDDSNSIEVVQAKEILWGDRFDLYSLLRGTFNGEPPELPDAVVVESFFLYAAEARNQINSEFPSVRVIGAVEAFAHLLGISDRIFFQPASLRKFVKILPEHEHMIQSKHVRDAYQHARYYVVRQANYDKQKRSRK